MRVLGNGFIICDVETCMNREAKKIIMKVNFIEFCNQIKIVTKCFLPACLLCSISYFHDFCHITSF